MAFDDALAERLRDRLRSVGVHGDDLIVRVDQADTDAALARPGVRLFDITGRPMRGWLLVAGEVLDEDELGYWVERARAFVATLPPK
jgi:hypothetical protein